MIALAALAGTLAGCADSHLAATSAGAQGSGDIDQPRRKATYQTGYGLSSDGPTTDLYTELFGAKSRSDPNAPAVTPALTVAAPQSQPLSAASAAPQPPPAAPQAAAVPPAPTATVYGIPSNGPTTDLYTELFRSKRPE